MPTIDARLTIRPGTRADYAALVGTLGQPDFFADRLGRARHNHGELLVAWIGDMPVGDVYLWCEVLEEPELRAAFPDAPLLNHLEVHPDWRGRGIGTKLVHACEEAARRRGYDVLLLGVGIDNRAAKRLYDRLGYLDWGHGPIVARWTEPDGHGGVRFAELTVDTMVRSLLAPPHGAWDPWPPTTIAAQLSGVDAPWHVAGGRALDMWAGTAGRPPIRPHHDVEIALPRPYLPVVAKALTGASFYAVGSGAIRPMPSGGAPPAGIWQIWVARDGAYRLDLFLEPGDGKTWIFRRDDRIARPYSEAIGRTPDGLAFLRPECVLLYKARTPRRPEDDRDFATVAPHLAPEARSWLAGALALTMPGHPWIRRLWKRA